MYAERRAKFMAKMDGGVAIIPAFNEVTRSADTHYRFKQNPNFTYLTGFMEPDAVALLIPEHDEHKFVLFVRPRDPEREIWDGVRAGPEGAKEQYGADEAYPLSELETKLPGYLENQKRVYCRLGHSAKFDKRMMGWINKVRAKVRRGIVAPSEFLDAWDIINEQRLIKTPEDLRIMRKAGQLSMNAHRHGMFVTKPGMNEHELQAEMEYYSRVRGASGEAYTSIVASGDGANILHYIENNKVMKDGDLVLVDYGCELDEYASDITRTWPVNGKFTPEQKLIYDAVLKAQEIGINATRPGNTFRDVHRFTTASLAESLLEMGVIKGDLQKIVDDHLEELNDEQIKERKEADKEREEPLLRDFFMHNTGHWIGMDVHDVGNYRLGKNWRLLEPGMCTTVEPGLYFGVNNKYAPDKFKGIGIRIEDDILTTEGDPENLTIGLPRTTEEVEAACASKG